MNAYFISGLGADKRIFSKLKLHSSINIIHLDWIPFLRDEPLEDYAIRLSDGIDTSKPFALVGISFGGMIATEIAKKLNPTKTIVISSTVISKHLPKLYQLAGRMGLIRLIPSRLIKSSNKITGNYYFGVKTDVEKNLLAQIINDTDKDFLKWAIGSILKWNNLERPKSIFHIHGTNDKILYSKSHKPDVIIQGGTHFMVYQNAEEISEIINDLILENKA